jgi:hypothetical protein
MLGIKSLLAILAVTIALTAFSAPDVSRCILLTNAGLRLDCYDALFLPENVREESVEQEKPLPGSGNEAARTSKEPIQREEIEDYQEFGKEQLKSERTKKRTESITAQLVKMTRRTRGEYVFELDNGQVWVQSSPKWFKAEPGDPITISKFRMGGYSLRNKGGASTRVRRLN